MLLFDSGYDDGMSKKISVNWIPYELLNTHTIT